MRRRAHGGSAIALALSLAPIAAAAGDEVGICFDYGCAKRATLQIDDAQLVAAAALLAAGTDAASERAGVARLVGLIERWAGEQSPTWRDRGGNLDDDADLPGRLDCIDESTNATAYLELAQRHGWLRFHVVGARVRRVGWLVAEHWAAQLVETATGDAYAVDSWFHDNGEPAEVFRLDDWLNGASAP